MAKSKNKTTRKRWLWGILATNLGVLGYFKYHYFLTDNLSVLASNLGLNWQSSPADIILPIGISFYTFHSLSYCIDVYYRRFKPVRNWRDYALYVSFFPQLVAGPIVRWTEMQQQIETPRSTSLQSNTIGLSLIIWGLFTKVVLADSLLAPTANDIFSAPPPSQAYIAWLGALVFGSQIFCDFAGYSSCAIGSALLFSFRLPVNFLNPYCALGFSDFWRRWHISLSSWLRDYLYIPLGGNRKGTIKTYRNLVITMLLGGLWHGAAWTFIVWGLLHGLFLISERLVQTVTPSKIRKTAFTRLIARLITLSAVSYAWIWFRSPSLEFAQQMSATMFSFDSYATLPEFTSQQYMAIGATCLVVCYQWVMHNRTEADLFSRTPAIISGAIAGILLAAIITSPGDSHAFIYFQF
ncbi:MBOAT family O-acyltransferase [Gilvimarinus chinensis]|uniref:MBOAT family O-acyltransferase n=1 Tax=Gilvimarinus chinensis TaxID=396005 RepID=UPI0014613702|nr:MBOAT family protein [Gilvimarinus chinensis]